MQRMRLVWLLPAVVVALLAAGCGGKVTYLYDDAGDPGRVTGKIEERSFFSSENLETHYQAMQRQTDALIGLHRGNEYQTDAEKIMGGIITAMLVEKVSTVPAPRTMADVFDRNLTSWLSLGLQAYQVFDGDLGRRSRSGSPDLIIEGDGNNLVFDSQLGTGAGSRAQFWFGDYATIDAESNGHGSYLSLDASRPYEYRQDNSRTTTQTWTDSPTERDGGLF